METLKDIAEVLLLLLMLAVTVFAGTLFRYMLYQRTLKKFRIPRKEDDE